MDNIFEKQFFPLLSWKKSWWNLVQSLCCLSCTYCLSSGLRSVVLEKSSLLRVCAVPCMKKAGVPSSVLNGQVFTAQNPPLQLVLISTFISSLPREAREWTGLETEPPAWLIARGEPSRSRLRGSVRKLCCYCLGSSCSMNRGLQSQDCQSGTFQKHQIHLINGQEKIAFPSNSCIEWHLCYLIFWAPNPISIALCVSAWVPLCTHQS